MSSSVVSWLKPQKHFLKCAEFVVLLQFNTSWPALAVLLHPPLPQARKDTASRSEFDSHVWGDVANYLPAGLQWQRSGNAGQFWSPGRSLSPDAGRAVCGWATPSTFGNDGFPSGPQFPAFTWKEVTENIRVNHLNGRHASSSPRVHTKHTCNDEASSLLQ